MSIQTINPATGAILESYRCLSTYEVDEVIAQTQHAYLLWSGLTFQQRADRLHEVSMFLQIRKEIYAELISKEMGKPITAAIAEIEKCSWGCDFYAEQAEIFLAPREVATDLLQKSYVIYRPLGIIFGIMPWNYPFWQVFRFAAANLMAGNTIVLKHADITTGVGLAIEELFQDAELPRHVFRSLVIHHDVAAHVIHHPHIRGVTLTGSVEAGRIVSAEAAKAIKKSVLELGGNDPYIVLSDAHLEKAAEACVLSRLSNSGQVCIAAKRIIVVEDIFEEFEQLVMKQLAQFHMGDPLDPHTNLGPLSRADLREKVHQQVLKCIEQGATLLYGGEIPNGPGFYYPPTVLKNIKPGMPAWDEEIFGPVIALISARDEEEAISIANSTPYGLSAAIFTGNSEHGEMLARDKIQVGTCYVNQYVASDPRLPFGGIYHSGYGRELGEEGIREFMNIKTIGVK